MVQDIHAHKGEGCLFLDCFEWISRTGSTRTTQSLIHFIPEVYYLHLHKNSHEGDKRFIVIIFIKFW